MAKVASGWQRSFDEDGYGPMNMPYSRPAAQQVEDDGVSYAVVSELLSDTPQKVYPIVEGVGSCVPLSPRPIHHPREKGVKTVVPRESRDNKQGERWEGYWEDRERADNARALLGPVAGHLEKGTISLRYLNGPTLWLSYLSTTISGNHVTQHTQERMEDPLMPPKEVQQRFSPRLTEEEKEMLAREKKALEKEKHKLKREKKRIGRDKQELDRRQRKIKAEREAEVKRMLFVVENWLAIIEEDQRKQQMLMGGSVSQQKQMRREKYHNAYLAFEAREKEAMRKKEEREREKQAAEFHRKKAQEEANARTEGRTATIPAAPRIVGEPPKGVLPPPKVEPRLVKENFVQKRVPPPLELVEEVAQVDPDLIADERTACLSGKSEPSSTDVSPRATFAKGSKNTRIRTFLRAKLAENRQQGRRTFNVADDVRAAIKEEVLGELLQSQIEEFWAQSSGNANVKDLPEYFDFNSRPNVLRTVIDRRKELRAQVTTTTKQDTLKRSEDADTNTSEDDYPDITNTDSEQEENSSLSDAEADNSK